MDRPAMPYADVSADESADVSSNESSDANAGTSAVRAVRERYTSAAKTREAALCCPVDYDPALLKVIPDEVIERDYGCGDPSRFVREGDVVLDLGSGGGKICFIASQIVGESGRVIGVDMNDDMLELARRAAPVVAERTGHRNVEFRRGRIQDLALDVDRFEAWLTDHPASNVAALEEADRARDRFRRNEPMIPDESIDIVVSNCVLNLVQESDKERLIDETFRVLRPYGRLAISDIVSDEPVPESMRRDPELWSGCVSGAFQEHELLLQLERAGFSAIQIDKWEPEPFAIEQGIEFRSITVTAIKDEAGPCLEAGQAVLYRGPWKRVEDDDGHTLERGVRTAVCEKTHRLLTSEPYAAETLGIEPETPIAHADKQTFKCAGTTVRHPRETKGGAYRLAPGPSSECCG